MVSDWQRIDIEPDFRHSAARVRSIRAGDQLPDRARRIGETASCAHTVPHQAHGGSAGARHAQSLAQAQTTPGHVVESMFTGGGAPLVVEATINF